MKYLLPIFLFTLLAGCDPSDDNDFGFGDPTITDLVTSASDLTTLEAAVIEAGLADDLNGGEFTVFAPTDDAFAQLLVDLDVTADELLARDDLATILGAHVVPDGTFEADDLEAGATFTTLDGGTLTILRNDDGRIGIDADGDGASDATVSATDLEASNGVVHKISRVLFDVADAQPTITDLVVAADDLTTLEAAVIEADLAGTLAGDGPFTVFAPTDAAFQALLDELDITAEELLARDDLGAILQLHVLGSVVMSGDLADGATVTTLNGQTLTVVALDAGGFGLDTEDEDDEPNAVITTADISASNGVVHKIDAVLLPAAE